MQLDPAFNLYTEMNDYLADVKLAADTAFDFEAAFQGEVYSFIDAVQGRGSVRATADDGVALMKILDAIYRSAETGEEVLIGA